MNHKPATPLPWTAQSETEQHNPYWHMARIASGSAGVADIQLHARRAQGGPNLAYIVHAANAYPRLVAALRETMRMLADVDCGRTEEYKQAAALLADIGEQS